MKKSVWILFLLIVCVFCFIGKEKREEETESKAVFISYIELQEQIKGKEEKEARKNIQRMVKNSKDFSLNTIILQVRPACDAIYPSDIFPVSKYISDEKELPFDILQTFIEESHKNNIKLIAWINPYRIQTTEDISMISKDSPAYPYIGTDTIFIKQGVYWNPSKKEVEDIIVRGVQELLEYDIDGLLFDDYFYQDSDMDINDYEEYQKNHFITKEEYQMEVVNHLIRRVHQECQKKNISFGVSPDGNIQNNYDKHRVDIKKWLRSKEYVDFIMPQIYYGFYNSTKAYTKVIEEWESILLEDSIDFYVALAFYKVGKEDYYAREGQKEWLENDNIIMREVLLSRNLKNYKGFSLFRYDHVFDENQYTKCSQMERANLKKIIK